MRPFLDHNFLLSNNTAEYLYFEHAKDQPIIDYHCHLSPKDIAEDRRFKTLTEIWLEGDHYKWRAMRANGVNEKYCTGDASDYEKFEKWAETVPYTMRNPLYHWTHMELQRPFGIHTILNASTAREIYDEAGEQLGAKWTVRSILEKMKVETICTTDDPSDDLSYHQTLQKEGYKIKVFPAFRADKVVVVSDAASFNAYLDKLGKAASQSISSLDDLLSALRSRHDFFASLGCKLSDHGLETFYAADFTEAEAAKVFAELRSGKMPAKADMLLYQSFMLHQLALMDHEKGWTQQFHIGALRNNSKRMLDTLGPDTGFDSMGDFEHSRAMSRFFDRLDSTDQLAKTILYNLNSRDNELFATMAGNFNDGSTAGKMQYGSAWWFLDQKDGMEKQINALSNMGLLSRFVGMLTDSRSFLSYPRHDYFRRILCNLIGTDVHNGELPNDREWLGKMVENICYFNAKSYFGFNK
ncbi:glucuronate isomerase [uncultured Imperialibacter sp.]|uniref:glucuronate isomerase n=1 Tax=uncultured Imperialibacter sp. TaxID=1672639 RepID=UPI0030D96AB4|tara:strand:- start:26888 stop:28291 length:1404 start_codon:yes stop_codon:yes gene_type:complete